MHDRNARSNTCSNTHSNTHLNFTKKLISRFALEHRYDLDEDGEISEDELCRCLLSIFKVLFKSNPDLEEEFGCDAIELAEVSADDAFQMFAKNNRMTIIEFRAWLKSTQGDSVAKLSHVAASSFTLSEIRKITGLETLNFSEILEIFAEATDLDDGTISLDAFTDCLAEISRHVGQIESVNDEDSLRLIVHELFQLFDQDNSDTVDMVELSSGMAVLAGCTLCTL